MSRFNDYDYLLRLALIGDSGVGKSALLARVADDEFTGDYISTIGVDFALKTFNIDGKKIKLQMWDTAGQERFHNITMSYYRSVDAIILVYDVCDENTFINIKKWYNEAKEYSRNDVQLLLIGNKCDKIKKRKVLYDDALNYSNNMNISFYETSAKNSTNVNIAFNQIVKQTVNFKLYKENKETNDYKNNKNNGKISLDDKDNNSTKIGCCNVL